MDFLKEKLKNIRRFYPYNNCPVSLKIKTFIRVMVIKFLNLLLYPDISLIDHAKSYYGIKTEKEFLKKYLLSKSGFDELWQSKPRDSQKSVESFYQEHDKDVWRQVQQSKYGKQKRKYVLMVYSIISSFFKNRDIKILDFGCGAGTYGHYLDKKGYHNITFADIKGCAMDFIQKEFGPRFNYVTIDNPLKEKYDVALILDCLAHAFNPFEEVKHVLEHVKPGGIVIMYYEKGVEKTHLLTASQQRQMSMDYIYSQCDCIKEEEVFIKRRAI